MWKILKDAVRYTQYPNQSSSYKLNILVSYTKVLRRERECWRTTHLFQLPHWCGPTADLLMRNLNFLNRLQKFIRAGRPLVNHM